MSGDWQRALDYLYGFTNWETRQFGAAGEHKFELGRIVALLDAIDNPQSAWPAVHVGGTNGKGSTCAMVAAVLTAAGYRVGLYTSPHLHTVRERIQVNGRLIDEAEVMAWIDRRRETLAHFPEATTFEVLTALAFDHFAATSVDIAVIEVGLGGRLDTTRVITPVVCALTPISLDHMEVLGSTVRQIASDKVGILRPGTPLVTAPQVEEAEAVIEAERLRLGCPRLAVGVDIIVEGQGQDAIGQRIRISRSDDGSRRGDVHRLVNGLLEQPLDAALHLDGPHQRINAGVAVGICLELENAGWGLSTQALVAGLADARWPARFERFDFGGERSVIYVDGAHNPGSMDALRHALEERAPGVPLRIILGVGLGKDLDAILDVLTAPPALKIVQVLATRSEHPKAMSPETLAAAIASRGLDVVAIASPLEALEQALRLSGPEECILATGSLFLAADIREALAERGDIPMPQRDPPR